MFSGNTFFQIVYFILFQLFSFISFISTCLKYIITLTVGNWYTQITYFNSFFLLSSPPSSFPALRSFIIKPYEVNYHIYRLKYGNYCCYQLVKRVGIEPQKQRTKYADTYIHIHTHGHIHIQIWVQNVHNTQQQFHTNIDIHKLHLIV